MDDYSLLTRLNLPGELKKLSGKELDIVCNEIRALLVETLSRTGGHLASNFGAVELTVAIHSVFDSPNDTILFDVGHQCYTHKILTGRLSEFHTLRQEGGISGFPKSKESVHDAFISGHAGNAISAARGIAYAKTLKGEQGKVVAVVGDGAFTNGLTFEGINNNAGRSAENLIVILNDNAMSISKNEGALAKHLAKIRSRPSYFGAKDVTRRVLRRIPLVGKPAIRLITKAKTALKESLYHSNYFEGYGFTYLGPVDGHDVANLKNVLARAKSLHEPVFIHVDTVKGKGFTHAEENPGAYHGISAADLLHTDKAVQLNEDNFSSFCGRYLTDLGDSDNRICTVTAAMKYATGLNYFSKRHPERFFDVGIAEGHGVTFSAGLASKGLIPVFAVYSTFLQRAYDMVLHDAAIENTHLVLAVDRAGLVGDDGETHQGLFDVSLLSSIPGVTVYSPCSYRELSLAMYEAIYHTKGVVAVRYPRGGEASVVKEKEPVLDYSLDKSEDKNANTLVVTYGRQYVQVLGANAHTDIAFDILKLTRVHPIPDEVVALAMGYRCVLFVEEGILNGSVAEHFHTLLAENGFCGHFAIRAVNNQFVPQASVASQLKMLGLDAQGVAGFITAESER